MRRTVCVAVAAIGLCSLVACGSSKSSGVSASGSGGNAVDIKNFAFNPKTLDVKVGTTVTFTNSDSATHTATDDGVFDSKDLNQNATFTYTFTKPGNYRFICSIHQYMKGEVDVTP